MQNNGMYLVILIYFVLIIQCKGGIYEGETCEKDGRQGVCRNVRKCDSAIKDVMKGKVPLKCFFDGYDLIICCLEDEATLLPQSSSSDQPSISKPTEDLGNADTECEPIASNMTSQKIGRKSWDKCIEYQDKYIYPCKKGIAFSGDRARFNNCGRNVKQLTLNRTEEEEVIRLREKTRALQIDDASPGEFPVMALLGFGDDAKSARWWCGGTIISEKFILTSARCTSTRNVGPVTFVRLGNLKVDEPFDPSRLHRVIKIIHHPDYKPPTRYNNIALLETETEIHLDRYAMPACLPVSSLYDDSRGVAIGFGATKFGGPGSNNLHKVTLTKFQTSECIKSYPPERLLKQGFQEGIQTCYGDKTTTEDVCLDDSGSPLLINNKQVHCAFIVVGVIAFGRGCGYDSRPALYTKVSAYTPWIESVVWPDA